MKAKPLGWKTLGKRIAAKSDRPSWGQALRSLPQQSRSLRLINLRIPRSDLQMPQTLTTCQGQQGTALTGERRTHLCFLNDSRDPGMQYVSGARRRTSEQMGLLQPEAFPGSARNWLCRSSEAESQVTGGNTRAAAVLMPAGISNCGSEQQFLSESPTDRSGPRISAPVRWRSMELGAAGGA